MAEVVSTNYTQTVDTAIGSLQVTSQTVIKYDIDDFAGSAAVSLATYLQMVQIAENVDPQQAKGRRVVSVGGTTVGGY